MQKIIKKYLFLVEKISNTTRMAKTFGTDVDIYRSEIHIVKIIGEHEELYVSEIAKLIGVTKGTISQIVRRLEDKGLVNKYPDPANNTRQMVRLTSKGKKAHKAHDNYHSQKYVEMQKFLNGLNEEQLALLDTFLFLADGMIDGH